jgi:hypothetical protein
VALSFCSSDERGFLRDIERLTRQPIQVVDRHPFAGARPGRGDRARA